MDFLILPWQLSSQLLNHILFLRILEVNLQNLNCKLTSSGIQSEIKVITSQCVIGESLHIFLRAFLQAVQALLTI